MEYIFLAADALVVSTLYWVYKNKTKTLNYVTKAVAFDPKVHSLEPGAAIEYGMVVGHVKPDGLSLESYFHKGMTGVVQVLQIKEHRTRLQNSFVSDSERVISRVVNYEPFSLVNDSMKISVQVDQPLKADYILNNLNLTHTVFEPSKDSALAKILSVVITDQHARGHETTEFMLPAGRVMTAFGRIEKLSPSMMSALKMSPSAMYRISAPSKSGQSYIVSSMSKDEIIEDLKSDSRALKVGIIILGSIGVAIAGYCIYDRVTKYLARRSQQRLLTQAREQRLQERQRRQEQATQNNQANSEDQSTTCVVCLTNPREVVLVDCGHVCLCADCLENMPTRTCPICRRPFTSFVPCFIA